ncbi:MAG: penicillin-binding protein 2 [Cyanobacteria bacterium P01_D01_bin.73]
MTLFQIPFKQPASQRKTVGRAEQGWALMAIASLLIFGGLAQRLYYLQLVKGETFSEKADSNRIQTVPQVPSRGNMFDRNGKLLAASQLSNTVSVWRTAVNRPSWPALRAILSDVLDLPEDDIQERVSRVEYESRFLITLANNVPPIQITTLLEQASEFSGIDVSRRSSRNYPQGELGAQTIGYIGEISQEELDKARENGNLRRAGYRYGDIVGKTGLEKALEGRLRGRIGKQRVEINGQGELLEVLEERPPVAGEDLTLTLDANLQRAAERALGSRLGAVVALNPNNGEVYAIASQPTFDPNIFTRRIDEATWQKVQAKRFPFLNRALRVYPPASTFKVATAIAALESEVMGPGSILRTRPYLATGGTKVWEWNKAGFGSIGWTTAMAWSSNTFFGQTGIRAGEDQLLAWSRRLGFGSKTGIEVEYEESSGLVPSPEWKLQNTGKKWHNVDTVNTSIGQGFLQASPLQVAILFAAIANGGKRIQPHLVRDGKPDSAYQTDLDLKESTLKTVRRSLRAVVTSGTGKVLASGLPPVAGKSGTAEDPPRETHARFAGYAPFDKPEIVVVAFVENGGGGGSVAGPVTRQVFAAYFDQKAKNQWQK